MTTALVRPIEDRKIAGVAAGIADRFGWKRSTVRALGIASIILPGPQVLMYLACWALIPDEADLTDATVDQQLLTHDETYPLNVSA